MSSCAELLSTVTSGSAATGETVASAAVGLATLTAWCLLTLVAGLALLTVLASLPGSVGRIGRLLHRRLTPPTLGKLLAGVLGLSQLGQVGLGTAVASAAGAATSVGQPTSVWASASFGTPGQTHPTPVDWPGLAPSDPPTERIAYTVRAGDSLWAIAERELGSQTSPAETDERWRQWYAENRAVIGEDPGLIHPGQVLVPPDGQPRDAPEASDSQDSR